MNEVKNLQSQFSSSYTNPIWSSKSDNNQANPFLGENLQKLNFLNKQLDEELSRLKPFINSNLLTATPTNSDDIAINFLQTTNENTNFPRINGFNSKAVGNNLGINFTSNQIMNDKVNNPQCIRREGMLKIRDVDQKDKDVVVTYAVLTKERLSYFVNAKDESSIQGSIELAKIKESLKLINGFPTCFTIKTIDGVSDCSVCAESEDSAREWINAITQNAVNCNTMSALNNLNARGMLK